MQVGGAVASYASMHACSDECIKHHAVFGLLSLTCVSPYLCHFFMQVGGAVTIYIICMHAYYF